ncbi:MAG: hypothetical protein H7Z19_24155 [Chitinophagaceae bacterium]|nr:hypothetical protein [Rubrivivax sp.]
MNIVNLSAAFLVLATMGSPAGANAGHQYIASLPEGARNERLTEMLRQLPEPCVVQKNFFRGFDQKKAALWSVACANKKAYAIMINDDTNGSTRIMDCKVLMDRAKVDCLTRI